MRAFILNLTYLCNNHCEYCVSHNTRMRSKRFFTPEILIRLIETFEPNQEDLFILSGGEPSLSPYLIQILEILKNLKSPKIIFTNGSQFTDLSLMELICTSINRIVISFYGPGQIHDALAHKNVYNTMCQGIHNLIKTRHSLGLNVQLDIKFIANMSFVEEVADIRSLIHEIVGDNCIDGLVLARLLHRHPVSIDDIRTIHQWASQQIHYLEDFTLCKSIKLVDYWPCLLDNNIFKAIEMSDVHKDKREMWFFDGKYPKGKLLDQEEYHASHLSSCSLCFANQFCGDSVTCYGALTSIKKNEWRHLPE